MFTDAQIWIAAVVIVATLLITIFNSIGISSNNNILQELLKNFPSQETFHESSEKYRSIIRKDKETINRLVKENDELKHGKIYKGDPNDISLELHRRIKDQIKKDVLSQENKLLSSLDDQNHELITRLAKSEKRCSKLTKRLSKAADYIEESVAKIESLNLVIADRNNMIHELIAERDTAKKELTEVKEALDSKTKLSNDLWGEREGLNYSLVSIEEKLNTMYDRYNEAATKRDELAYTLIEVQKELQESKDKVWRLESGDPVSEKTDPPAPKEEIPSDGEVKEPDPAPRKKTPTERRLQREIGKLLSSTLSQHKITDIRVVLTDDKKQYKVRARFRKMFQEEFKWTNTIYFQKESGKTLEAKSVLNVLLRFI